MQSAFFYEIAKAFVMLLHFIMLIPFMKDRYKFARLSCKSIVFFYLTMLPFLENSMDRYPQEADAFAPLLEEISHSCTLQCSGRYQFGNLRSH